MIKVSAQRSIARRMALTKAADEYSSMMQGYAAANRGLVGAGVRIAVNDNLRKSRTPVRQVRPAAQQSGVLQARQPIVRR